MATTVAELDAAAFEGPRRMRMDEVVASERLFRACFGAPALEDEAGVLARYVPPRRGDVCYRP